MRSGPQQNQDQPLENAQAITGLSRAPLRGLLCTTAMVTTLLAPSALSAAGSSTNATVTNLSASQNNDPFTITKPSNPDEVLFEADGLTRDNINGKIVASGNVRAYFGEQLLVADEVEYNPATDIVVAKGHISITDSAGEVYYADQVELSGDLADGIATNFAVLLADDSKLAGTTVIKSEDGNNELNNAIFTACKICEESELEGKIPTWQIKAGKITQDKSLNVIKFNNAVIEAFGIPVFYSPYLQVPDPSVERQSGLLVPDFGTSSRLGAFVEIPYYFAISDYQDFTFSPKYMSEEGLLLQGEYRIRDKRGRAVIQAGYIDQSDEALSESQEEDIREAGVDPTSISIPNNGFHFFGEGEYKFDNEWIAEFDIEHVSDKLYLRSYDVAPDGNLSTRGDLFRPDRLRSQIGLRKQTRDSLLKVEGLAFTTLRLAEENDVFAQALPRVTYEQQFDTPRIGGKTKVKANFLALSREEGIQSQRLSGSAQWEKQHTTKGGHRFNAFSEIRADAYRYDDLDEGTEFCNTFTTSTSLLAACQPLIPNGGTSNSEIETRILPTIGVGWSYPLVKQTENATFIIEPRAQIIASTDLDSDQLILNEDSQFFEFDTTNLFEWSKSTGYDLWEDGQRINLGVAAAGYWNNNVTIKGSLGQQYRRETSDNFGINAGLNKRTSDVVGTLEVRLGDNLTLDNRFRYDQNDSVARRIESRLAAKAGPVAVNATYLKLVSDSIVLGQAQENDEFASVSASYRINDNWVAGARIRQDIESGQTTERAFSIGYRDECTNISLLYRNDLTQQIDSGGDEQLTLQIELARFKVY